MASYAGGVSSEKPLVSATSEKWTGAVLNATLTIFTFYIGEKNTENMLLIEVMTVGADFSLTFMQSGRGEKYLNAFMEEIRSLQIPVNLVGEERYTLCNTELIL